MEQTPELWQRKRLLQLTWEKLGRCLEDLRQQISRSEFRPTSVVGICRGGLTPAAYLSHALKLQSFYVLSVTRNLSDEKYSERGAPLFSWIAPDTPIEGQRVLIVDDITGDGGTLALAQQIIGDLKAEAVRTAVIVRNVNSSFSPDYSALSVNDWVVFPWEPSGSGTGYEVETL